MIEGLDLTQLGITQAGLTQVVICAPRPVGSLPYLLSMLGFIAMAMTMRLRPGPRATGGR